MNAPENSTTGYVHNLFTHQTKSRYKQIKETIIGAMPNKQNANKAG